MQPSNRLPDARGASRGGLCGFMPTLCQTVQFLNSPNLWDIGL